MSNGLLERVNQTGLISKDDPIILGISGGVDSVVLADLLSQMPGVVLHLAHVNYGLRGASSDKDQKLCETLAERLQCQLHVLDATDSSPDAAIQEWARNTRYSFFADLGEKLSVEKIAVAHHKDDQVETVLHNFFRGAGIRGLSGMKMQRPLNDEIDIVRPLLQVSREEILQYAKQFNLDWREDKSNSDEKYTRSWMRSVVIPMLESKYGSGLKSRVANSAQGLAEVEKELLEPELLRLRTRAVETLDAEPRIRVRLIELGDASPIIIKQLLLRLVQEMNLSLAPNADLATKLFALTKAQKGKRLEVGRLRAVKEEDSLSLGIEPDQLQARRLTSDTLHVEKELDIGHAVLQLRVVKAGDLVLGKEEFVEYVDFSKIHLPLSVRPWIAGDQFRPLGMKGHKLVSDFLTDKKVDNWDRKSKVVVLSNDSIMWIPGYGISEDFKLDSDSELALKLTQLSK